MVPSALGVPLEVPLPLMPFSFPVPLVKVQVPASLTGFPASESFGVRLYQPMP